MNLCRWKQIKNDPFEELFNLDNPYWGLSVVPTFEQFLTPFKKSFDPAIDVNEDKDNLYIKVDLPGLKKQDIHLSLDGHVLTIRGERKYENDKKEKGVHRMERAYGTFQRSLDIDAYIDQSKVQAKYKDGVLNIVLPKTEQSKAMDINIEEN